MLGAPTRDPFRFGGVDARPETAAGNEMPASDAGARGAQMIFVFGLVTPGVARGYYLSPLQGLDQ